ncbi:MAG: HNH endonuclease [Fermentimonas sp.]|nr:HNH endonuclease [Fermentimonas sp.]
MDFPELKPVNRDREYKSCNEITRDKIVYEYLFNGRSHRWLDENVIGLEASYSRGYMAMGVLHYLGIVEAHKGIFKDVKLLDAINGLTDSDKDRFRHIIKALIRYSENIYSNDSFELFIPSSNVPRLIKTVGISQYTDGVRIDKEFHSIFNPEESSYYVQRGSARQIKVLFNNRVFDAEYRYENQTDKKIELQSIRFKKELKEEFKKVFPESIGEFVIQQGADLNHFVFSHRATLLDDDSYEFPEGRLAYRIHRIRERNPEVIRKAKAKFIKLNAGKLFCEACGFDFVAVYGERGINYIEGHHKKLVSEMKEGEKTKIEDISMLCSNCHRMIHKKPLISVDELSRIIKQNKSKS